MKNQKPKRKTKTKTKYNLFRSILYRIRDRKRKKKVTSAQRAKNLCLLASGVITFEEGASHEDQES